MLPSGKGFGKRVIQAQLLSFVDWRVALRRRASTVRTSCWLAREGGGSPPPLRPPPLDGEDLDVLDPARSRSRRCRRVGQSSNVIRRLRGPRRGSIRLGSAHRSSDALVGAQCVPRWYACTRAPGPGGGGSAACWTAPRARPATPSPAGPLSRSSGRSRRCRAVRGSCVGGCGPARAEWKLLCSTHNLLKRWRRTTAAPADQEDPAGASAALQCPSN
jgi:hypothetical protein